MTIQDFYAGEADQVWQTISEHPDMPKGTGPCRILFSAAARGSDLFFRMHTTRHDIGENTMAQGKQFGGIGEHWHGAKGGTIHPQSSQTAQTTPKQNLGSN